MKAKISKEGEKVTEEFCPHCQDKLVVQSESGAEVFICDKCKFKIQRKK